MDLFFRGGNLKNLLLVLGALALVILGWPVASAQSGVSLVTLEVQKDGVSLGGGYILNYTGLGVSVLPAGGGKFNIDIPGGIAPTPTPTPVPTPPPPPPDYGNLSDLPGWGWQHLYDHNFAVMESTYVNGGVVDKKSSWVTLSTNSNPNGLAQIQRRIIWDGTSYIDLSCPMAFSTQVTLNSMVPGGTFCVRWGQSIGVGYPADPVARSFGFKVDDQLRLWGVLYYGTTYYGDIILQDLGYTLVLGKTLVLSSSWTPGYGVRFWVNVVELSPILSSVAEGRTSDNNKINWECRSPLGGNVSAESRFVEIWQNLN